MLYTTTITVARPGTAAPYEDPGDPTTIAMGVAAHIGQENGRGLVAGGPGQESVRWRLDCDLVDVIHGDLVTDERTHDTYVVTWASTRQGLGLDHVEASMEQTSQRAVA